jgi:hypothetical protein
MNSTPWFHINDTPVRSFDGTEVVALVSRFETDDIVVEVDTGVDVDVECSGYAQRLAMVEDLSFFFGGINV